MKRNKFFKTGGFHLALIMLVASFSLTSCLKDNGPGSVNFGDSPALVGFQYAGIGPVPMVTKILGKSTDASDIEVTLSVASLTLKTPVTVNVVPDPAGFNTYKTNVDTNAVLLPSTQYALANGGKVTISPGQQIVKLHITFTGDQINFNNDNTLAFKLQDASGATIASNLSEIILKILLKSIYEGAYTNNGTFFDTGGAITQGVYPEKIELLTVSKYVVDFYDISANVGYGHPIYLGGASYFGSFSPEFTIDPTTSKVTGVTNYYGQNSGAHSRSAVLDPTGINATSGTPGTVGFKISVKYIMVQAGTPRVTFTEVYTFTNPI
ncbi:protein of unknown function [Mucilaginibacter mallensis]|uniref:BT-3987-like N-terminal domain-containing protein n=1 Tax=Mucilaginibacter mallensis TaxID=652787 RepID=A0A1H2BRY5_MUCMA|nr:DUF1735 domain-containing protein [Mucilaginibacter mallensis]SDT60679.1 protein of unknown function [Mucilaginibacter mallensis]